MNIFLRSRLASYNSQVVHRVRRSSHSTAPSPLLVDTSRAPGAYDHSAVVYEDIVTETESKALVADLSQRLKRRRYEVGHWDAVITKHKETELIDESFLSVASRMAIEKVRQLILTNHLDSDVRWLPCHAIDYHSNGELNAHVDSVRFSGKTVSGLSLLSSGVLRLRPAPPMDDAAEAGDSYQTIVKPDLSAGHVDLLLPPRSLYVLTGASRYEYTHELLPPISSIFRGSEVPRERRLSVIFRDALWYVDHLYSTQLIQKTLRINALIWNYRLIYPGTKILRLE